MIEIMYAWKNVLCGGWPRDEESGSTIFKCIDGYCDLFSSHDESVSNRRHYPWH